MRRPALVLMVVAGLAGAARMAAAQTQVLIVSGLGGEKKFTRAFADLSQRLADALHTRFGIPDSDMVWLGEDSGGEGDRTSAASRPGEHRGRHASQARPRAGPGTELVLVLIGHGSGSMGEESKISIPGPDLTAARLRGAARARSRRSGWPCSTSRARAATCCRCSRRRTASSSRRPRARSSATSRTSRGSFVDALTKDVADTDKDGRVSLLEAFRYAAAETKRFYDNDTRLQTEHAQLDD